MPVKINRHKKKKKRKFNCTIKWIAKLDKYCNDVRIQGNKFHYSNQCSRSYTHTYIHIRVLYYTKTRYSIARNDLQFTVYY